MGVARRVEMRKRLFTALLILATPASADERFNCPKPEGVLSVDQDALFRAYPSHMDRIFPDPIDVDFRCRVDGNGSFVDCVFAARQSLTEAQQRILDRMMPRVMRATTTDIPSQDCVASKVSFHAENRSKGLVPSPDETAAEGEVPDRTDQNPA